jgi:hypothetical protein
MRASSYGLSSLYVSIPLCENCLFIEIVMQCVRTKLRLNCY